MARDKELVRAKQLGVTRTVLRQIDEEDRLAKEFEQQERAANSEIERSAQELSALQARTQEEATKAQAQIAKTKVETEVAQRETGERRLARLRARIRSTSRPLLSKGVSL